MIEIRKLLQAYLKSIHPRVYFQDAPKTVEPPYLVFDLPNSVDDGESREQFVVDIDGWDVPGDGDTTELEELMANVDGDGNPVAPTGLNKRTLSNEKIAVTFYRDTRLALNEPDLRIKRRKNIYQAIAFLKGDD